MPENALHSLNVDYVLPLDKIAATVHRLSDEFVENERLENPMSNEDRRANKMIQQDKRYFETGKEELQQSILTCPECGGVLWEMQEGNLTRYQCHVGHAYSEGSLFIGKTKALEDALWVAVRSLKERASLSRKLANRADSLGKAQVFEKFHDQAEEADQAAQVIRSIITNGTVTNPEVEHNTFDA
jgi:two-component system chemotaxis response regulator CheB